jgi:hypothetical protein
VLATALYRRPVTITALFLAAALVAGAAAASEPKFQIGLLAAACLVTVAVRAPMVALCLLLVLTCVVPYGVQNQLGVGGGQNSPGLLLSDLLLASGVIAAILVLAQRPVDRRTARFGALLLGFLAIVALQFLHGVRAGNELSRAGQEFRVLLGFGTFLIAARVLGEPGGRDRLMKVLLGIGITLGLWGLLQWFGHISFGAAGDVGVRPGVRLTSAGSGQLQGGEYGFPVVIVCCVGALVSGATHRTAVKRLLWLAIGLNAIACLVTFERTFWLSTMLGIAFVVFHARRDQRNKALLALPLIVALSIGGLSVAAPSELTTAKQRLLSIGQANTDDSVRYRVVETRFVMREIQARPLAGSGLAATIFWGQPWAQVPAKSYAFSHNGYAWLAWKVGIPAAALLVLLILGAIALRPPPGDDADARGIRRGAQGALLGLLLCTMTFPSFSSLSITPAIGVLLALAVAPRLGSEPAAGPRLRPVPTARPLIAHPT